jgi:hypothetical protein
MAGTPSGTQLQRERAHLQRNLYTFPRESTVLPPGLAELVADPGPTSIRQLLTATSTWRGPGAYLLPMGVWPHLRDTNAGMFFQLGPVASDRSPLLSDAQLLGLVCEGSPEPRPSIDEALRRLHLDVDDPAALQRARHAALIFARWRALAAGRRHRVGHRPARCPRRRRQLPAPPVPRRDGPPHRGCRRRPSVSDRLRRSSVRGRLPAGSLQGASSAVSSSSQAPAAFPPTAPSRGRRTRLRWPPASHPPWPPRPPPRPPPRQRAPALGPAPSCGPPSSGPPMPGGRRHTRCLLPMSLSKAASVLPPIPPGGPLLLSVLWSRARSIRFASQPAKPTS